VVGRCPIMYSMWLRMNVARHRSGVGTEVTHKDSSGAGEGFWE
jgi:hypothetical protein